MKYIILFAAVIFTSYVFTSCKKNNDDSYSNKSRVIQYEVRGNFTGSMFASYTTLNGGTSNDSVSSLPWNKEITYNISVTSAIFAFSGNGGVAGEQITIVVKRGSKQVYSNVIVVGSSGSFTQSTPVLTF